MRIVWSIAGWLLGALLIAAGMAYLGDSLYIRHKVAGANSAAAFGNVRFYYATKLKNGEVHYLSGFTAEQSVRARLISTLWIQTVLVCEPQYGASRGGAGEARGYRFFPGKILCPSRSCTGEAATELAGLIAAMRAGKVGSALAKNQVGSHLYF